MDCGGGAHLDVMHALWARGSPGCGELQLVPDGGPHFGPEN